MQITVNRIITASPKMALFQSHVVLLNVLALNEEDFVTWQRLFQT